jgi:hypothetical protein
LSMGAELRLTSSLNFIGELQIDDNVGFVAGFNYSMF